jgi:hypothetical protein
VAKGVSIDLIVDPKKAIAGIGQVEGKASSASDTLGRLGKVAGGALLGVAAAGAAGAVALGAAVVKAYSSYEQLAGGVTKLFGNADKTVEKFAAQAARTAGLSTNQYLDTVTSFSASLIAGLHGDQVAAARVADTAIRDMADNANTFGTSIGSIQLAYQSFAKGNFTLLDNLKLGFGGSQQGMADLINTSGVLGKSMKVTAQNVKDVPFDKMVEAIHKVQQSMGIAGTTAREAAGTIQGSFDATKASLHNLVTGLGVANSDFKTLVGEVAGNAENLAKNVTSVLERLIEALPQVAPVIASTVKETIPSLLDSLAKVSPAFASIKGVFDELKPQLPTIESGFRQIGESLGGGMAGLASSLGDAFGHVATSLVPLLPSVGHLGESIAGLVPPMSELVKNLLPLLLPLLDSVIKDLGILVPIVDFLTQSLGASTKVASNLLAVLEGKQSITDFAVSLSGLSGVVGVVYNSITHFVLGVIKWFDNLVLGGLKMATQITNVVGSIPKTVVDALAGAGNWLVNAGRSIIQGLINGITSKIRDAQNAVGSVMSAIARFFPHSPAKEGPFSGKGWTLYSGQAIGEDLSAGIMASAARVRASALQLMSAARIQTSGGFDGSLIGGLNGSINLEARATLASTGAHGAAGGSTVVVNFSSMVPSAEGGRAVVNAIQEYVRGGGRGLGAVLGNG